MGKTPKSWYFQFVCAVVSAVILYNIDTLASDWPIIQPLHETHTLVNQISSKKDSPFLAVIKDTTGNPVYKLECHTADYENDSEMNFSGDYQCALFALHGSKIVSGNLLAANTPNEKSTDWWNRGRLRSAQLRGECLLYSEYSGDRHFRLRGMLITMSFTNIQWSARRDKQNDPGLEKVKLIFDVAPDSSAKSMTAELPSGPEPPRTCYP